jgi:hypothetical protein
MNTCVKCGKDFKYPSKLKEHLSRKKQCFNIELDLTCAKNVSNLAKNVSGLKPDIVCHICDKAFTRTAYLKIHESRCKGSLSLQCHICLALFSSRLRKHRHVKKNECVSMADELKMSKIELEKSQNEVKRLKNERKLSVTNNINNNFNNNFNNNININLTGYDENSYSHMEFDVVRALWSAVEPDYGAFVRKFVQEAHKNNPNLKITNLRSNTALEYNGNKYESVPMTDAIVRCLENVAKCLDEKIPLQRKLMRLQLSTRFNDLIEEKYLDFSDDEEKQEELELHKKCKDNVKHGLYKPK